MEIKGKFYIRLNITSPTNYYWYEGYESFVADAYLASFYDTYEQALEQLKIAEKATTYEAVILDATRNLP